MLFNIQITMSINTVELGPKAQAKLSEISARVCRVEDALTTLNLNTPASTVRTPNRTIIAASTIGAIPAGYRSFTVTNIGVTDVLLDGVALASGRSNTFTAGNNDTLSNMTYDTQLSSIELLTIS